MLLFLEERVANRPLRTKSRKAGDDVAQDDTRLSWRSVRAYVTAITDLYREQKGLCMNTHPSPREDNAREYLKSLQRRDTQRDLEQFADKGRDTLLDGYSEDEFERVCSELWERGATSPECHFRTLVDILLGHYMLTRGGDRREAEISDLFAFEFKGEGPTRCLPLIFTTRAGKENQFGRLETIGAMRHKKPLTCMLSGLGYYLLQRWDLGEEAFPDFSERSAWYKIRLIKGTTTAGNARATFSYNSQRDWVERAFQYAGVFSQKKTHIGRSAGAKMAELKGITEEQIRRAGRWNRDQMLGCYLNCLPREFMRVMAGHPREMGCYEIRRAAISPPDILLSMIWPQLDSWKGRFGPQPGQIKDLAAGGVTDLLFYLREVILQDSVALRQRFPRHPVWNHRVFQHEAYVTFSRELEAYQDTETIPNQLSVFYQAMPQLADQLQSLDAQNEHRFRSLDAQNERRISELKESIDHSLERKQLQLLQLFAAGSQAVQTEALRQQELLTSPLPPPDVTPGHDPLTQVSITPLACLLSSS
jgi:Centromere DNA-binding protein complex CBF3 subunit, domain 2